MVAEATGLQIMRYLSGSQGGDQQISARISCDEIDLLLFFRDPMTEKSHEQNEIDLFRLCDMRNIPVATNIATADVIIHGLERGYLYWRYILRRVYSLITTAGRDSRPFYGRVRRNGRGGGIRWIPPPLPVMRRMRLAE